MNRFVIGCLVVVLCSVVPALRAQSSVDGYWEGGAKLGDEEMRLMLTFRTDASGTKGFLDNPDTATSARQLVDVKIDGSKAHFVMPNGDARIPFDAQVDGDTMGGILQFGPAKLPFTLTRRAPD